LELEAHIWQAIRSELKRTNLTISDGIQMLEQQHIPVPNLNHIRP